jgi:hypothetical protein
MCKTLLAGLLVSLGTHAIPADAGNLWPPRNYDPGVLVEWNAPLVDAAAAQAAHDVLVALLPSRAPAFNEALANRLGTINPNRAQIGAQVGREVARKILEWHAAGPRRS